MTVTNLWSKWQDETEKNKWANETLRRILSRLREKQKTRDCKQVFRVLFSTPGLLYKIKMRRRAGVAAIQKKNLEQEKYKDKGTEIQENQLEQMTKQIEVFRVNLEEFARKHKHDIKSNPQFRKQFQDMCAAIGVDPLTSVKGFWSVLGIGDFYYELAVQIIEVCLATSSRNGGLIGLEELRRRLIKARGQRKEHQEITTDDLLRAAKKLKVFGTGFSVIPISKGQYLVQSVPGELSIDHTAVLHAASTNDRSHVSVGSLQQDLQWEKERAQKALDHMIKLGLAWIDYQNPEPLYWFPSLFEGCIKST